MLTQVIVQSSTPMTLKVEDIDPTQILILKSITGLSPEGLTLFTGDFARDGGYYQGRRISRRNVVMTFKLNPDYAYNNGVGIETSDIRELLYRMFLEPLPTQDGVQILLDDDRKPDRYFVGYCEAINTDMWSSTQEASVTLVCVDPYLRSVTPTAFSDATGVLSTPVTYDGSADTGLTFQVKVVSATQNVYVKMVGAAPYNDSQTIQIQQSTNFAVNDLIDVVTVIGSRSIKKNGANVMAYLQPNSDGSDPWLKFKEAAVTLSTHGGTPGDGKTKIMSYSFKSAWWGV